MTGGPIIPSPPYFGAVFETASPYAEDPGYADLKNVFVDDPAMTRAMESAAGLATTNPTASSSAVVVPFQATHPFLGPSRYYAVKCERVGNNPNNFHLRNMQMFPCRGPPGFEIDSIVYDEESGQSGVQRPMPLSLEVDPAAGHFGFAAANSTARMDGSANFARYIANVRPFEGVLRECDTNEARAMRICRSVISHLAHGYGPENGVDDITLDNYIFVTVRFINEFDEEGRPRERWVSVNKYRTAAQPDTEVYLMWDVKFPNLEPKDTPDDNEDGDARVRGMRARELRVGYMFGGWTAAESWVATREVDADRTSSLAVVKRNEPFVTAAARNLIGTEGV
uniref:Uncharacterized protein n=1 Tax=viral metagenome TaxID=1070528 RepID=A0A2V0RKG2_9ZZZZ